MGHKQRWLAVVAVLVGGTTVIGPVSMSLARVSPLRAIEGQIQSPNALILLDTSSSMYNLPGEQDLDLHEAGPDCEDGDKYCRTTAVVGRCFRSSGGMFGPQVRRDYVSCTSNSQCNSVGRCKNSSPLGCLRDSDCSSGNTCVGKCSHNKSVSCSQDSQCGSGRTCQGICSNTPGLSCTSNADCAPKTPCAYFPDDVCITDPASTGTIKMCRVGGTKCLTDADCTAQPNDGCGPASSRMIIAKRAINSVVQNFYQNVNFGFMTFIQGNYYPYYEVSPANISSYTRTAFLDRAKLESASPTCFAVATGPTASCLLNGETYTLVANQNSRYRLNRGTYFETLDYSWGPGCGLSCKIPDEGTGLYEGSYYTVTTPVASSVGTEKIFGDYAGKVRIDSGKTYIYYESPSTIKNVDDVNANNIGVPFTAQSGSSCSSTYGAYWNSAMVPFMDTAKSLDPAKATNMARLIARATSKASFGGVSTWGSTPSGCALKNAGTGASYPYSAYHYLEKVKNDNTANGVACRPNLAIFLTDGVPTGHGDNDCSHPDCALSPPGAGCDCLAVKNAWSLSQDLDSKLYVVGFSATVSDAYAKSSLNNMAKAGGTKQAFYALNEESLYQGLTSAIYDSVQGSYSTSPVSAGIGGNTTDPNATTTILLDSRADFPSWQGHLIAYDISGGTPQLIWDAAEAFDPTADPDFWKKRNVWTSDGYDMIKIEVDAAGNIGNAADLAALDLGATEAEAALVARWMLGDPALSNPAVLGAIINSTPIQLAYGSDALSLTFVAASDGMLHAFHSRTQIMAGQTYTAGTEAFAYIPQEMLPRIRQLYAQGGQRIDPREFVFGAANSPKVKRICIDNCDQPGQEAFQTVMLIPHGFGGDDLVALDVSSPFGSGGIKTAEPPVRILWDTENAVPSGQAGLYDLALGLTVSVPGFYYGKSTARDDYRTIFASGYGAGGSRGLVITNAEAKSGMVKGQKSVVGLGNTCAVGPDPADPTLLADVAVARRFQSNDTDRIAAGYFGDTWGNLYRYVPETDEEGVIQGDQGTASLVDAFGCGHPLHYSPTIVQLDRHSNVKHPGEIFITQVTNSSLDVNTAAVSASYPPSQLIIRRDLSKAGSDVEPDTSWGQGLGRIVLDSDDPAEICGEWDAGTGTCQAALPAGARPIGTPTGVLREDFEGFALISLWYVPDPGGCSKGETYVTIHEVEAGGSVGQIHGTKIADEPVVGAVFVGGKLFVALSSGPQNITSSGLGQVGTLAPGTAVTNNLVDRYRRLNWTELP